MAYPFSALGVTTLQNVSGGSPRWSRQALTWRREELEVRHRWRVEERDLRERRRGMYGYGSREWE